MKTVVDTIHNLTKAEVRDDFENRVGLRDETNDEMINKYYVSNVQRGDCIR